MSQHKITNTSGAPVSVTATDGAHEIAAGASYTGEFAEPNISAMRNNSALKVDDVPAPSPRPNFE